MKGMTFDLEFSLLKNIKNKDEEGKGKEENKKNKLGKVQKALN